MAASTATSAQAREVIPPSKFSHVVFKTARYREMLDWYMAVLGARVVQGNDRVSFLTYDNEHHRIAIVRIDGLDPRPRFAAGVDHVSYTYDDLGDLLATYKRLKAMGIEPRWPVNHGVTTSFYYQDPDGNRVELQFENFPTDEELNDFFESPEFAANTLGGLFDPDELIRRYEAGEPVEELVRRPEEDEGPSPIEILTEMDLYRP